MDLATGPADFPWTDTGHKPGPRTGFAMTSKATKGAL